MKKLIKKFKVMGEGANIIEVSLAYEKGGINYFTGENTPRGYYLYVTPSEVTGDGWKRTKAFAGNKKLVKPVKRFSRKVFESLMPDYEELLSYNLKKNNLKLV